MPVPNIAEDESLAAYFEGVEGAQMMGVVPLREGLINDVLRATVLVEQADRVRDLRVVFLDNNLVHVRATVKVLFAWPTVELAAQLENLTTQRGAPVLRIQVVPLGGGLVETFLPVLLSLLPFPESVTVSGRQVDINLHTVFTRRGLHEIAALIKRLQVKTRRGLLTVGFVLRVDEQQDAG
jgi:hypothetical protein